MNTSRVPTRVLSASMVAIAILGAAVLVGCSSGSSTKAASSTSQPSGTSVAPSSAPASPSAGSSSSTVAPAGPNAVNIVNYAFGPKSLTVKVGTTVTWKNLDQFDHQVASSSGDPGLAFVLPAQGADVTASHTFTAPGTYQYICNIHNYMKGTIVVTP